MNVACATYVAYIEVGGSEGKFLLWNFIHIVLYIYRLNMAANWQWGFFRF